MTEGLIYLSANAFLITVQTWHYCILTVFLRHSRGEPSRNGSSLVINCFFLSVDLDVDVPGVGYHWFLLQLKLL